MKSKKLLLMPMSLLALTALLIFILAQRRDSLPEGFLASSYMHNSEVLQHELQNYIQLQPAPERSTERRIVFRLMNNTDKMYLYDARTYLYIQHEGMWKQVSFNPSIAFNDILVGLAPHSYIEERIYANTGIWGRLPPGEYIVVKHLMPASRPYPEYRITAIGRFTIP